MAVTSGRIGFRRMSQTSQGCVTLWCRLLVTVRPLHLVVLFSTLFVVRTICTASRYDFLAVNWVVGYTKENFPIFLLYGDLPSHVLNL